MKNKKTFILLLISLMLFIAFSIYNEIVKESIKSSLNLCYSSIIPSLFPYFIITEIIISSLSTTKISPTLYAYINSLASGFPSGTSSVCKLYDQGIINKNNAISLLYCTANASSAYIIAFVGINVLKNIYAGIAILIAQTLSSVICVIIFKPIQRSNCNPQKINYAELITDSISKSISSTLSVCGYITFMGIIADFAIYLKLDLIVCKILFFVPDSIVRPIFIGTIEITRGLSLIEHSNQFSVITAAIIVGFSGISVILQCVRFSSLSKLPSYPIIINKIIYTFCMPIITLLITSVYKIPYLFYKNINFSPAVPILIIFSSFFLYFVFDKYVNKLYNKEKTKR